MFKLSSFPEEDDDETGERISFKDTDFFSRRGSSKLSLDNPPVTKMEEDAILGESWVKDEDMTLNDLRVSGLGIVITPKEEREVDEQVRAQFTDEFKRINQEARERQKELGKLFMTAVEDTRNMLVQVNSEKSQKVQESRSVLQKENLEEKQEEILRNRALRKLSMINSVGASQGWGKDVVSFDDATKTRVAEMDILRKTSDERSKARRKSSVMEVPERSRRASAGMKTGIREVHTIIVELHNVDLKDHSKSLQDALKYKEESEALLLQELEKEREKLRQAAMRKKKELMDALCQEKLREMERLEAERLYREEMERRMRIAAALKRRERNRQWWKEFNNSKLETSVTRITFSYFDLLPFENKDDSNGNGEENGALKALKKKKFKAKKKGVKV